MLDYTDFGPCRTCPYRDPAHGCTEYGGEKADPLTAVARCIETRPWVWGSTIGVSAGLSLIDQGRFLAFIEGRHLLKNVNGPRPPKGYLAGFVYGALAYRLYRGEMEGRP
ncbi:MAG: hypothetical protein PHX88_11835 [Methanoculleus horonobensis]|jgi:hypothetical protein|nr:hypothetical protein [Methanoculleus horonobensis]